MIQGSKEWLEYRSKKVGSSDAPVIMDVSPYKNIYDLYLEKTGKREPRKVNKFVTDKGNTYEDLALLDLEKETGLIWKPEVFVKEDNDFIISSVDGFCEADKQGNPLFWECKYVGRVKYNNFINELLPLRERVSEQYYPQVIHHCLTTGGRDFYFSVVVDDKVFPTLGRGKLLFKHVRFSLSIEDEKYMNEEYQPELLAFIEGLKTKTPPMGIATTTNEFIDLQDSQLKDLVNECSGFESKCKQLEQKIKTIKNEIFEMIKPYSDKVMIDGNKISVTTSKPKEYVDYEMLVKENPHILKGIIVEKYKRHTKPRITKRITYKKIKDNS